MSVRLYPHHVLCSIGFVGEGYNDAFVANMSHIVRGQLRAIGGEATPILISRRADSICAPCPSRIGHGCAHQPMIETFDLRHRDWLGFQDGERLT